MAAVPLPVRSPEGVPDSRGLNLFEADPSYRGLLELYLDAKLRAHLLPHFTQLGAMAGADLDELATFFKALEGYWFNFHLFCSAPLLRLHSTPLAA